MGYLQDFERELEERLADVLSDQARGQSAEPRAKELVRWVKEQLLASYHNGQAAGPSRPVGNAPPQNGTKARPARPARKAGQYRR